MIKVPGVAPGRTSALVEEVDILPTIAELATGMTVPPCSHNVTVSRETPTCTEGFSAAELVRNPTAPFKQAAFSQFQRYGERVMGYTIRGKSRLTGTR